MSYIGAYKHEENGVTEAGGDGCPCNSFDLLLYLEAQTWCHLFILPFHSGAPMCLMARSLGSSILEVLSLLHPSPQNRDWLSAMEGGSCFKTRWREELKSQLY